MGAKDVGSEDWDDDDDEDRGLVVLAEPSRMRSGGSDRLGNTDAVADRMPCSDSSSRSIGVIVITGGIGMGAFLAFWSPGCI